MKPGQEEDLKMIAIIAIFLILVFGGVFLMNTLK